MPSWQSTTGPLARDIRKTIKKKKKECTKLVVANKNKLLGMNIHCSQSTRVFFSSGTKELHRSPDNARKIITFRGKFFLRALWGATTASKKNLSKKNISFSPFLFLFLSLYLFLFFKAHSHVRIPRCKVSRSRICRYS